MFRTILSAVVWTVGLSLSAICPAGAQSHSVSAEYFTTPLFKGALNNPVIRLRISVKNGLPAVFTKLDLRLDEQAVDVIEKVEVYKSRKYEHAFEGSTLLGAAEAMRELSIPIELKAEPGLTWLWLNVSLKQTADITRRVGIVVKGLTTAKGSVVPVEQDSNVRPFRVGVALRKAGDDNVHTYRIPGLATTDKGTLIAVYDIRHTTSRDLPGNVDVGMSRSTDGGRTWEPMKTIMDMGPPHDNNGIGDPSILFDPVTRTIWVAALWSKGDRSIAGSEPGLSPDETGQFVLVSSQDDGVTWSEPYNITSQVKDPKWHIYFQGPGAGMAMADGTLVFPSQFWDESKKPGIPHSSIIYSKDHGKTWRSGVGAKPNTTEAQVVETKPGVLMLNMRDNRGRYRSVSITSDLGKTWAEHHTSQHALPDPICMASLIKAKVTRIGGQMRDVLFFSNVASPWERENMTIRASFDLGESWRPEHSLLIDERPSYGYSCLTRIDPLTLGILYEGEGDLYFVRIPVGEVIK